MARADRRRDARAKAAPSRGAFDRHYESAYVGTEGLFFQRLRKRAKWIFVFLALTFGITFVLALVYIRALTSTSAEGGRV